jgi:hypothetical protein
MVTLQKNGLLSLNSAAVEALGNAGAAELLYDPEASAIGLRKIDLKARTAFRIRQQKGTRTYKLSLARLCTYYEIDTSIARRYAPVLEDNVLIIDLNNPIREVARPRGGLRDDAEGQAVVE